MKPTTMRSLLSLLFALFAALAIVTVAACSDDTSAQMDMGGAPDLATGGSAMDMGCFMNPTTHVQIINACTSAQSYDKTPFYPAAAPNGVLPPLP